MVGWSLRGLFWALTILCVVARSGAAAEDTLARSLAVLAEDGLKGTPEGLSAAEGAYQRAKRLAPGDGRVDYGWSLVLTKHRKFDDAAEAFEKSLAAPQLCLEARLAEVRSLLKTRKFSDALDRLIEAAELVADPQFTHFTPAERSAAAAWIGQVAAFLAGPLGDPEIAATVSRREPALIAYLGELRADFERGKRELSLEHRKLQDQLALAIDDAEDRKVDALRNNQGKLDKLDSAYKSLSTEGSKAQETANEKIADIESQLGSLETRYKAALAAESRLMESIVQININIVSLQRDLERFDRQNEERTRQFPQTRAAYVQKIFEMQIELELLQTDLAVAQAEKDRVLNQAGATARARLTALSQQQQLELQKSQVAAKYQKTQRALQDENRKLAGTTTSRAGRAQGLRTKIQSWGSYDKTTPQSEFQLLLGLN